MATNPKAQRQYDKANKAEERATAKVYRNIRDRKDDPAADRRQVVALDRYDKKLHGYNKANRRADG